ncbi:MAG: hypothetical protein IH595_11255 [Bacteroidales bacterium]|nr:hypothetical protein [Bacteroidales bacterium]
MNKYSFKLLVFIGLITAPFLFEGCNSLFKGNNPYYKVTSQFRNFCYFNNGSEWTYQNDSTGIPFKLAVNDINTYVGFQSQNPSTPSFSYDVIEMLLDSNSMNMTKEVVSATNILSDTTTMNSLLRIFYADSSFVLAFAPQYPLRETQIIGGAEGLYTNMEIMPYYNVLGKKYDNVYHSQDKFPKIINGTYTNDSVTMDFYIAEHYGIIKWTALYKGKTSSYSLVSSDLKQ